MEGFSAQPDDQQRCSDAVLLKSIARQDQTAFSQLYDRYARLVYAVAFKSLGSVEESEEVVLDVFAQVWRTADRYDATKARVDTWLMMITRSRGLDRLRSRQRRAKIESASIATEIQSQKRSVDPIEAVFLSERRTQVTAALSQLPEAQRQAIELAYYGGLSHSEIADQTGASLGTVKSRIRLGLNKLRLVLDRWEPS